MNLSELLVLPAPLVLASRSPRRISLLSQIGLSFDVIPSGIDEEIHAAERQPEDYASHLALMKAREVSSRMNRDCIVIGADTIVVLDNHILNKPIDNDDAFRMLRLLSGRTHIVITGIALVRGTQEIVQQKKTLVTFRQLSDKEMQAYIDSGSPMDKAGAYGIQDDFGAVFVERVEGCYYNIVGLPLELLYSMLKGLAGEPHTA
jgi:septum formation protein